MRRKKDTRLAPPTTRDKTSPGMRNEENGVVASHSWGIPMPLVRMSSMPPKTAVIPRKRSTRMRSFFTRILYQRKKENLSVRLEHACTISFCVVDCYVFSNSRNINWKAEYFPAGIFYRLYCFIHILNLNCNKRIFIIFI